MADPLAELADRQVPERTNYFDPAASQSMVSRYANARRNYETSGVLAKAYDDQSRRQAEQARTDRQQVLWNRDDEEYQAKKDALAQQGEFLTQLAQLDHTDPDYVNRLADVAASMPPELLEQPAVKSILTFKDRAADDARRQKDMEAAQNFRTEMFDRAEAERNDRLERQETARNSEFDRRQETLQRNRIELANQRKTQGKVQGFITADRQAFPRHMDALIENYKSQNKGKAPEDLKKLAKDPKWMQLYREAEAWDKKPLENELSAALTYENPEEYVGLVPNISESQKARRRQVWEHAHEAGAGEEPPADGESLGAPVDRAAPASREESVSQSLKTLDKASAISLMREAGNDKAKARQLAKERGYQL